MLVPKFWGHWPHPGPFQDCLILSYERNHGFDPKTVEVSVTLLGHDGHNWQANWTEPALSIIGMKQSNEIRDTTSTLVFEPVMAKR